MTETSPPKRFSFWLTVSLLVNMVLIGLVIGMSVREHRQDSRRDDYRARISRDLQSDERQALRAMMRDAFRQTKAERDVRSAAREQLAEAINAEPFDEAAVDAAFMAVREADHDLHAATHRILMDKLEEMPVEQRRALMRVIARGPSREHGRDRGGARGPDGLPPERLGPPGGSPPQPQPE